MFTESRGDRPAPGAAAPGAPLPATPAGPPPALAEPRVTVGRLVGRTFSTWKACFVPFALLGLVYQLGLMGLGWALGSPSVFARSPLSPSPATAAWAYSGRYWAYMLAMTLVWVVAMGALTGGAVQHLAGRPVTVGGMLRTAARRAVRLAIAGLLALLATYLGLFLLVVPGILFGVWFSLVAPVVVGEERSAWASLWRSRALTKGSRWTLLGTYVICGLVAFAPRWLGLGATLVSPVLGGILMVAASVTLGSIVLVAPAVAWQELRMAKEGASAEELARVFE